MVLKERKWEYTRAKYCRYYLIVSDLEVIPSNCHYSNRAIFHSIRCIQVCALYSHSAPTIWRKCEITKIKGRLMMRSTIMFTLCASIVSATLKPNINPFPFNFISNYLRPLHDPFYFSLCLEQTTNIKQYIVCVDSAVKRWKKNAWPLCVRVRAWVSVIGYLNCLLMRPIQD